MFLAAPISFLDFASLELLIIFAIFLLVGLFSHLCGQVAFSPPQVLPKGGLCEMIAVLKIHLRQMTHNFCTKEQTIIENNLNTPHVCITFGEIQEENNESTSKKNFLP